jgi:amidase
MTLTPEDYVALDATSLAQLVRSREISARELAETAIARIEALNPTLNAVVFKAYDAALAELDARTDAPPFLGVPYLIKDLHAPVRGMPLTNGSRLFGDARSSFDSTLVARIRAAGFVILGRTNSPEFGLSVSTEPVRYGPTRNPWNLAHIAGGSSGGAGAAVASGMLPAAHATDSAGSIRVPASCNGLVGLKPTRGLNPYGPHRGDAAHGISHENAVTRSVRDTAALLDVSAGPDVGAPYFSPPPEGGFVNAIARPPRRLRIAFWPRTFRDEPIDRACSDAVLATALLLQDLGHSVEEARPSFDVALMVNSMMDVLMSSLGPMLAAVERDRGRPIEKHELEPLTHAVMTRARRADLGGYLTSLTRMQLEVRRMADFFVSTDILVTATLSTPPPRLGCLPTDTADVDGFLAGLFSLCPFTAPFNASGQPAISLPLQLSDDGLPIGVQLAGRYGADAQLLQLAAELELAAPWATARPPCRS